MRGDRDELARLLTTLRDDPIRGAADVAHWLQVAAARVVRRSLGTKLRRSATVDDIVGDVVLEMIARYRDRWEPGREQEVWALLRCVARTAIVNQARRRTVGSLGGDSSSRLAAPRDPRSGPVTKAARNEAIARVRSAIARLGSGQREAVDALDLRQLPHREAAGGGARQVKAIEERRRRAHAKLRMLLGRWFGRERDDRR